MMFRYLLLFIVPLFLYAQSLKSLLEYAQSSNELIASQKLLSESKKSELKSSENALYPTVDLGGFYKRDDAPNPILPGTTYSGYATVSLDVYKGGAMRATIRQKEDELLSSHFNTEATKNSIELSIVEDFYNIKSTEAQLRAREEASKAVAAQLERMKQFFQASLATSDDVARLQSAYDANLYEIDSIKFQILSLKRGLEVKVGQAIGQLDASAFKKLDSIADEELVAIQALRATKKSLLSASKVIESYYYPQIKVADTYSLYGYADEPTFGNIAIEQLTHQNEILATLNVRLYDFDLLSEKKRAVILQADALREKIAYQSKEQRVQQELARERIKTAELNIKSSQSALKAASSALKTITKKYNSGIVDNVVYLDALSSQTEAKARYERALNNLELAYALYYFYNGKKLREYLSE